MPLLDFFGQQFADPKMNPGGGLGVVPPHGLGVVPHGSGVVPHGKSAPFLGETMNAYRCLQAICENGIDQEEEKLELVCMRSIIYMLVFNTKNELH